MTGPPSRATRPREIIDRLVRDTEASADEAAEAEELLVAADAYTAARGIPFSDGRRLALAAHGLAFVRRVRSHEYLPDLDRVLYEEVPEEQLAGARRLLESYCDGRGHRVTDPEVLLLALHFAAAAQEDLMDPGTGG